MGVFLLVPVVSRGRAVSEQSWIWVLLIVGVLTTPAVVGAPVFAFGACLMAGDMLRNLVRSLTRKRVQTP